MKSIIIQYKNIEEYSRAYKDFESRGFNVAVVLGMELSLTIKGEEIGWLTIIGCEEFERDMERERKGELDELNAWYGQQNFDMVEKITGIDIWGAYEDDDIEEGDTEKVSRTQALNEAREVWDKMSIDAKAEWKNA